MELIGLVQDEYRNEQGCLLPIPGDFDGDDDVDRTDLTHLLGCLTGTGIPQNEPTCQDAKLDDDNDVDLSDFGLLQRCLSGDFVTGDPHCAD